MMKRCTWVLAFLFLLNGFLFADTPAPPGSGSEPGIASPVAPNGPAMDAMTDILDIKPPESIGFDHRIIYGVLAVIGALVLIGLIIWLVDYFLKKRKKKDESKQAPLPPDVLASRELALLENDGFDDARDFYFRLTAIIKTYMDGRFGINAPEMTTEELFPVISGLPVEKKLAMELKELLKRSDPVKFAGLPEKRDTLVSDFGFTQSFIHQTRPAEPCEDLPDKH